MAKSRTNGVTINAASNATINAATGEPLLDKRNSCMGRRAVKVLL
jgi:hypothetical protein